MWRPCAVYSMYARIGPTGSFRKGVRRDRAVVSMEPRVPAAKLAAAGGPAGFDCQRRSKRAGPLRSHPAGSAHPSVPARPAPSRASASCPANCAET